MPRAVFFLLLSLCSPSPIHYRLNVRSAQQQMGESSVVKLHYISTVFEACFLVDPSTEVTGQDKPALSTCPVLIYQLGQLIWITYGS